MRTLRDELHRSATDLAVNTLYSYKNHYNESTVWEVVRLVTGIPAVALAAVAAAIAFTSVPWIAGAIAGVVAALRATAEYLKPEEKRDLHRTYAGQYHTLNTQVRDFLRHDFIDASVDDTELKARYDAFQARRTALNEKAPVVMKPVYRYTQRTVQEETEYTPEERELVS